jgi:hypothetical protein
LCFVNPHFGKGFWDGNMVEKFVVPSFCFTVKTDEKSVKTVLKAELFDVRAPTVCRFCQLFLQFYRSLFS